MKALLLAVAVVTTFSACQKFPGETTASTTSRGSSSAAPAAEAVQFEVRDFRLDKEIDIGGTTYKGRGTLVTRDPRLTSGNFIVLMTAKQAHESDEEVLMQVLLKDGIGVLSTYDYQTSEEKDEVVKYYDWKVLGYVPLLKGVIDAPKDTPDSKS